MRLPVTSLLPPQTECPPAPGFLSIDNSILSPSKDSQTKPWGSVYSTCKFFQSCNPHSKGEALSIMYTLSDSPPGRSTLTNCTADRHIKHIAYSRNQYIPQVISPGQLASPTLRQCSTLLFLCRHNRLICRWVRSPGNVSRLLLLLLFQGRMRRSWNVSLF